MEFYLDDCSDDDLLVLFLRQRGHVVHTPRSERTVGAHDADHLSHAAAHDYALITRNPRDFRALHDEWLALGQSHAGILLVYRDNNMAKDMSPSDIAHAIERLLGSGIPIANGIHILNHWR
jgi:hypothetical protein